jgi:hypothetical protein
MKGFVLLFVVIAFAAPCAPGYAAEPAAAAAVAHAKSLKKSPGSGCARSARSVS